MTTLGPTLAVAAATVGALHALAPDHWVPIAAVARARGWSRARTTRVALLCGFGHVTVSVGLGVVALISGSAVVEAVGARSGAVAGVLLIGFGVAYLLWGSRHLIVRKLHGHDHRHFDHVHDPTRATTWTLFAIYCADPCIAVVPIIFAAAPISVAATVGVVVVYEVSTMAMMVGLVALAHLGAARLSGRWFERWADSAAGGLIIATGLAVAMLGW